MPAAAATPAIAARAGGDLRLWPLIALVALALLAGGGGAATPPMIDAIIELAALAVLGAVLVSGPDVRTDRRAVPELILALVVLATIAIQLVPLPPALWSRLPGRDVSTGIRQAIGLGESWQPFTLDAERSRTAGLALLAPVAAFVGTLHADARARMRLMVAVVAVAVADLLLSMMQFAPRGAARFIWWNPESSGLGLGFFANRNHNADFLLIAPLLVAALLRVGATRRLGNAARIAAAAALLIFPLGVIITYSRTGLALVTVPLLGYVFLFASRGALRHLSPTRILIAIGLLLAAIVGVLALASSNNVVDGVLDRFASVKDQRLDFWPDAVYAARQLWPFGSGSGTFDQMFRSVERLDTVTPVYINHAHNDYLELVFELGLWGAALIAAGLLLYVRALWRVFATRGAPIPPVACAAVFALAVLLLHSLVDYPLRTMALGTLFGLLTALLFEPAAARKP